jgi:hypothetical protein
MRLVGLRRSFANVGIIGIIQGSRVQSTAGVDFDGDGLNVSQPIDREKK